MSTNGSAPTARPDVLIVVMDCVRASDFPGGTSAVRMPFVEELRRSAVLYPRAASVAPWTLPSHASLFTGLYPWEHGCHGKAALTLPHGTPRLAATLRGAGYRTLSLSANPIISPAYGLVDGFDVAEWGEWWEQVHRTRHAPSHRVAASPHGDGPAIPDLTPRERAGRLVKTMLTHVPWALAAADAVARRTVDPERSSVGNMNPWIEPDLARWLSAQPRDAPTFCFINYLDAHEPYLMDPAAGPFLEWWSNMRIPQDVLTLLAPPVLPPADDLERLHGLYRNAITGIDRRLERIVETYRRAGRWDRTLLILTSDHGQAFGENGMVWHGVRTDEEMLRVPLLLRLPADRSAGTTGRGWASPMDATATILEAAGLERPGRGSGVPLQSLISADRPGPLLSAGDGTEWNRPFLEALTPRRRTELNLFSVAAYTGSVKLVVEAASGTLRGYDLEGGAVGPLPPERLRAPELAPVADRATDALERLLHPAPSEVPAELDERLRSWGYG